jgi:hypothetical protein
MLQDSCQHRIWQIGALVRVLLLVLVLSCVTLLLG